MEEVGKEEVLGDFDPRVVEKRDARSGRVISRNPFRLHVIDGKRFYEHPCGSKNLWYQNRRPAGRLDFDSKGAPKALLGEDHEVWVKPLSADEKLAQEINDIKARNAALEKELQLMKAEKDKKVGRKTPKQEEALDKALQEEAIKAAENQKK